ncbi:glycoside hydrolase family 99-like domain-containing protein [Xanthobacter sp. DSM 24535]|uniref:glycoside hydrolase family 99-like domain-containing protein n=1 Tax=Roseixanthobacter psychrophilus TaxID=3119917 RepID=UPI00372AECAB
MVDGVQAEVTGIIAASGVFDVVYYASKAGMPADDSAELISHYVEMGEKLGFSPNEFFDPRWYSESYSNISGNLLLDYIVSGEASGRRPSPLFDPAWYLKEYDLAAGNELALAHYLRERSANFHSPNQYFDVVFYLKSNPDVATANVDPFTHFINWGVFEGRRCHPAFDSEFVWKTYLNNDRTKNPFRLFMYWGEVFGWRATLDTNAPTIPREIKKFTAAGPYFEAEPQRSSGIKKARVLAFYLPQFHTIRENDEWWGAGFTEWTNIPRGVPRFAGHYQPRVPRDLGFYELGGRDILQRQVEMARGAGLSGFCFYYYNFNGHRLLEKPLDVLLNDRTISFPFSIMWANENWTRRWDGMEADVLMAQDYGLEGEPAIIADMARYMKDERYIRINGRPFLGLYRADVIPDCKAAIGRWRKIFKDEHDLDPYIVMSQTFGNVDPRPFGFDAAMEFPPHKFGSMVPRINHQMDLLDNDFRGDVRSYDDFVRVSLEDFPKEYKLLKTVFPTWDNDARKQGSGMVVHGSNPTKFQNWASAIIDQLVISEPQEERLMFVNAWNEWCEGTYLEPDVHFGYAFLNALSHSISGKSVTSKRKILLVGHDAFQAGAQQLLFNIGAVLKGRFGCEIAFVLMDGGAMASQYAKLASTYVVDPKESFWPGLVQHLKELRNNGFETAITNSAFSGHVTLALRELGFEISSLIHELSTIVTKYYGADRLSALFKHSHNVVYPNRYVEREITEVFGRPQGRTLVIPQGLYSKVAPVTDAYRAVRDRLNIPHDAKIVMNAGYADLRKGIDLFLAVASATRELDPSVYFVWIGNADPTIDAWLIDPVRQDPSGNVRFAGFQSEVAGFYTAADAFFLTSREDPFPSVVLEALSLGLSVLAFDKGGGFVDLLKDRRLGSLIPSGNIRLAARMVVDTVIQRQREPASERLYRSQKIAKDYNFANYCHSLIGLNQAVPKISVVVPNYNYKTCIEARLYSVFDQTFPIFEVIVLDDCSTDGSVEELERIGASGVREFVLIENIVNSGNVFAQWAKGVEAATGDLIWIAEADDLSDPSFLENMVTFFAEESVAFAFSDSRTIDEHGAPQWESYKGYYETLFPGALSKTEVFSGRDFVEKYLSVKNVIMNVSSGVWRRDALAAALDRCHADLANFRMAGDWRLYIDVALSGGSIGYNAMPMNVHRRHSGSVTHALKKDKHLQEIRGIQQIVRKAVGTSVKRKQDAYYAEVAESFGLSDAETAHAD